MKLTKLAAFALIAFSMQALHAQQVTIGTPFTNNGSRFYQTGGVNFGFRYDSPTSVMFFRNGGGAPVAPFGQFSPTAGNTFGLRGRRGNWSWDLGISAGQGSDYYSTTTTPMLTLPNGGFGFINDSTQRPFVTGIVPVVGQQTFVPHPDREALKRRFAEANSLAKQKRAKAALEEAKKLTDYWAVSKNIPTVRKQPDPPLILGRSSGSR